MTTFFYSDKYKYINVYPDQLFLLCLNLRKKVTVKYTAKERNKITFFI